MQCASFYLFSQITLLVSSVSVSEILSSHENVSLETTSLYNAKADFDVKLSNNITNPIRKRKIRKRKSFYKTSTDNVLLIDLLENSVTQSLKPKKITKIKKTSSRERLHNKKVPISTIPKSRYFGPSIPSTKLRKTVCGLNQLPCSQICDGKTGRCQCMKGFILAYDGRSCFDVDECLTNNGGCQTNCTNTIGSYFCHCPSGLRLSIDWKSCEDINECRLRNGHGPCQDTCINTHGGYRCSCDGLEGTKLASDLHICADVDECLIGNGGCSDICINTFGKSFCDCPEGMELMKDLKKCQDINECKHKHIKKQCPHGCINTPGSYKCASAIELKTMRSVFAQTVCKPLFPPENGYYKCSRKKAVETFTKSGRKRIKNSIGTRCILKCPDGFEKIGNTFRMKCSKKGQWVGDLDAKCVPTFTVT